MSWDGQYLQIGIIIVPSTSIIEPRVKVKKNQFPIMDCHIPPPHMPSIAPIFPKIKSLPRSTLCCLRINLSIFVTFSPSNVSDNAARRDVWHAIDMSQFLQDP